MTTHLTFTQSPNLPQTAPVTQAVWDPPQATSSPSAKTHPEAFPRPSPSRTIPICLLNLLASSFPDMATVPRAWGRVLSPSRADVTLVMALLHPATAAATVYMAQNYLETNAFLAFF